MTTTASEMKLLSHHQRGNCPSWHVYLFFTVFFLFRLSQTCVAETGGYSASGRPEVGSNQGGGSYQSNQLGYQSPSENVRRPLNTNIHRQANNGGYSGGGAEVGYSGNRPVDGGYASRGSKPSAGGYGYSAFKPTRPPRPPAVGENNGENGEEYDYVDPSPSPVTPNKAFVTSTAASPIAPGKNQWDIRDSIPGQPGVDYPILSKIPQTGFSCLGRISGYYADPETRCQVFHRCEACSDQPGTLQQLDFLCPNGTVFNQQILTCDWWGNVECQTSEQYFDINTQIRAQNSDGSYAQIPLFRRPASSPKLAPKIIPLEQREPLPPGFYSNNENDLNDNPHDNVAGKENANRNNESSKNRGSAGNNNGVPRPSSTQRPVTSAPPPPPPPPLPPTPPSSGQGQPKSFQTDDNFSDYFDDDNNFIEYRAGRRQGKPRNREPTQNNDLVAQFRANTDYTQQPRTHQGFIVNRPHTGQNTQPVTAPNIPQFPVSAPQNTGSRQESRFDTGDRATERNTFPSPVGGSGPSDQYLPPEPSPTYGAPNVPTVEERGRLYPSTPADSYGAPPSSSYGAPSGNSYGASTSSNFGTPPSTSYGPPSANQFQNTANGQPSQGYAQPSSNNGYQSQSDQYSGGYGSSTPKWNSERLPTYQQESSSFNSQHPRYHRQPDEQPPPNEFVKQTVQNQSFADGHGNNTDTNSPTELSRYVTAPPPPPPTQDSYQLVPDGHYRKPSRGYGNDEVASPATGQVNAEEPMDSFGAYPENPQDSSWG